MIHKKKTLILTSTVDEAGSQMICANIEAFRQIGEKPPLTMHPFP